MATSSSQPPFVKTEESHITSSTTKLEAGNESEMQVNTHKPKALPTLTKTPEPRPDQQSTSNQAQTPSTPGIYMAMDWVDFEARYEKALLDADNDERELLNEFDQMVRVSQFPAAVELVDGHVADLFHSTSTCGQRLRPHMITNELLSESKRGSDTSL